MTALIPPSIPLARAEVSERQLAPAGEAQHGAGNASRDAAIVSRAWCDSSGSRTANGVPGRGSRKFSGRSRIVAAPVISASPTSVTARPPTSLALAHLPHPKRVDRTAGRQHSAASDTYGRRRSRSFGKLLVERSTFGRACKDRIRGCE